MLWISSSVIVSVDVPSLISSDIVVEFALLIFGTALLSDHAISRATVPPLYVVASLPSKVTLIVIVLLKLMYTSTIPSPVTFTEWEIPAD